MLSLSVTIIKGSDEMKRNLLTKILAILGTVLTGAPFALMLVTSAGSLIMDHRFRCDFLIPGELFPVILIGGGLLIWAALRAHSRSKLLIWMSGLAAFFLIGGQILAVVTGINESMTAGRFWLALVIGSVIVYDLMGLGICVGGVLLLKDLFGKQAPKAE